MPIPIMFYGICKRYFKLLSDFSKLERALQKQQIQKKQIQKQKIPGRVKISVSPFQGKLPAPKVSRKGMKKKSVAATTAKASKKSRKVTANTKKATPSTKKQVQPDGKNNKTASA